MCFRLSAAVANESQIQTGTCEKCGQPVAASIGITSGECPYCGAPIPAKSSTDTVNHSDQNVKIL